MEIETYGKKVGEKEYKLIIEYKERISHLPFEPSTGGEGLMEYPVTEWPDKVTLSISTAIEGGGSLKTMVLTGSEYRELRDLLSKDVDSGRYVGAVRPARRSL